MSESPKYTILVFNILAFIRFNLLGFPSLLFIASRMMVPPFDRAIFSKENKVGEVIGPVQTVSYINA